MISQSEFTAGVDGGDSLPLFIAVSPSSGTRNVVRLQFEALDKPATPAFDEAHPRSEQSPTRLDAEALERTARLEREYAETDKRASLELRHAAERQESEAYFEERLLKERTQVSTTCNEFKIERQRYFLQVEGQVVRLALAIAARVLHREVKLDPMLLQGVVKVALAKVEDESGTTLRVPLSDLSSWQALMKAESQPHIVVSGDRTLFQGECVLETHIGRVELGIAVQLDEIEKGFFDLLEHRPA